MNLFRIIQNLIDECALNTYRDISVYPGKDIPVFRFQRIQLEYVLKYIVL